MRKSLLSEVFGVIRPIVVFLVAVAVVATAMAIKGWALASFLLAGMLVLIGALLVVQVHRAVSRLAQRSSMIARAAEQAEWHYVDVLRRVVAFVESRDPYLSEHSDRVSKLSRQIAQELGLPAERCQAVCVAGQLHDLGMLGVRPEVLAHGAKLSVENFRSVKRHPNVARQLLEPLHCLADVLPAIVHHHERMNGTGYPAGLGGEAIPLEARILAVADAYDAMTHDRPGRLAMPPLDAMQELQRCTPSGYDPQCVEALGKVVHLSALEVTVGCA